MSILPEQEAATDRLDLDVLNPFRRALDGAKPLLGIWSMLNSANAVEGLVLSGYDWLLIDSEHSPISLADTIDLLRILEKSPTVPIVRLIGNDPNVIKQFLDAGAQTIMLPHIESRKDAIAAVEAMRYPPRGRRGVAALHRASRFGRVPDYLSCADKSVYLIVQVETERALGQLEDIIAVDGVDAVFFGPADLAGSMGLIGQPDHPRVTTAIESALDRVRGTRKAVGVLAPNLSIASRHAKAGFDFISIANDCALLLGAADRALSEVRTQTDQKA